MNTALLITTLGLLAAVAWGISDFFSAKAAKRFGPVLGMLLISLVAAIAYEVMYVLLFRQDHRLSLSGFGYAAAAGCLQMGGGVLFFIGLKVGPVSIVSPVTSVYPLVTTILTVTVFHATLTVQQLAGIALIILGVVIASGLMTTTDSRGKVGKGPFFALLTALVWGISYAFLAQAVKVGDWQVVTAVEYAVGTFVVLVAAPAIKSKEVISWGDIRRNLSNKFVVGAGVVQLIGFGAVNAGMAKSTVSAGAVIVAISSCYPVLTIFLALKHFNEELKFIPLSGALLGIVGVVLLSLT